jgi:hypothetical protein
MARDTEVRCESLRHPPSTCDRLNQRVPVAETLLPRHDPPHIVQIQEARARVSSKNVGVPATEGGTQMIPGEGVTEVLLYRLQGGRVTGLVRNQDVLCEFLEPLDITLYPR